MRKAHQKRTVDIRYFVVKPGRTPGAERYYWQPWTKWRQQGWKTRPLSRDFDEACREAERLNRELDRWRDNGRPSRSDDGFVGDVLTGVYIFGTPAGPVKIGVSRNLFARCSSLKTGSPGGDLLFFCRRPYAGATDVEARAHHQLRKRRLNGEWFDVSAEGAIRVVMAIYDELSRNETAEKL